MQSKSWKDNNTLLRESYGEGRTQMEKLIKKAKEEWGENWSLSMMEYDKEYNEIIVWVGRPDIYKAFFDADTLKCIGTKC